MISANLTTAHPVAQTVVQAPIAAQLNHSRQDRYPVYSSSEHYKSLIGDTRPLSEKLDVKFESSRISDNENKGVFSRFFEWCYEGLVSLLSGSSNVKHRRRDVIKERPKRSIKQSENSDASKIESKYKDCVKVGEGSLRVFADYHATGGPDSLCSITHCPKYPKLSNIEIINNGFELLDAEGKDPKSVREGILGFGAGDRPLGGVTPINDIHRYESDILYARLAGIDGLLVEWGYRNKHARGDVAIKKMREVLEYIKRGNEFAVVPVWLPTWTADPRQKPNAEEKQTIIQGKFEEILGYYDKHCVRFGNKALLFMLNFRGMKKSYLIQDREGLKSFFKKNPSLKDIRLAYRMGNWDVSENDQVVTDYPWITKRTRPASENPAPEISANFVKYGTQKDIAEDIKRRNALYLKHKIHLPLRTQAVCPGMDTRGASWSGCNSYLPREENGTDTYTHSWNKVLENPTDMVTILTYNDALEATNVVPTIQHGTKNILTTAEKSCRFKKEYKGRQFYEKHCDKKVKDVEVLLEHVSKIRINRILLDKLTGIIDDQQRDKLNHCLNSWANVVFNKSVKKTKMREKRWRTLIKRFPYYTKSSVITSTDILPAFGSVKSASTFNLDDLLAEEAFSKSDYFTEGDVKLRISRKPGVHSEAPVILSAVVSGEKKFLGKIYIPQNKKSLDVRMSLNSQEGETYGKLVETYKVDHPGCTVEVLEIRSDTYSAQAPK